jgi:hypothetical protein
MGSFYEKGFFGRAPVRHNLGGGGYPAWPELYPPQAWFTRLWRGVKGRWPSPKADPISPKTNPTIKPNFHFYNSLSSNHIYM